MAHGAGQMAMGAGQGALGGAGAGAGVGFMVGGPPGALVGAGVGAVAGGLMGFFGGMMDAEAQHEMEAALEEAEREYDAAQAAFNRQVQQSGASAEQAVRRGMAAKGASDAVRVESAMDDAAMTADRSGLIGAEKADYVAETRQTIEREVAAQAPAVYQQALGGARQEQAMSIQRAGMALDAAGREYGTKVSQISGQQLPAHAAAVGSTLGSITQASGALIGAGVGKGTPGTPGTGKAAPGVSLEQYQGGRRDPWETPGEFALGQTGKGVPTTDNAFLLQARELGLLTPEETRGLAVGAQQLDPGVVATAAEHQRILGPESERGKGTIGSPGLPQGLSRSEQTQVAEAKRIDARAKQERTGPYAPVEEAGEPTMRIEPADWASQSALGPGGTVGGKPISTEFMGGLSVEERLRAAGYTGFAGGGMAGQAGPEVAVLGEEGPELVLNAKQTADLAETLGAMPGYAQGGVAGLQEPSSPASSATPAATSQGAPTGTGGGAQEWMDPDELLEYMTHMDAMFKGVL